MTSLRTCKGGKDFGKRNRWSLGTVGLKGFPTKRLVVRVVFLDTFFTGH